MTDARAVTIKVVLLPISVYLGIGGRPKIYALLYQKHSKKSKDNQL
jgi:hypothetical protein